MRPTFLNPLFTEITSLDGIGPKLGKLIGNLCGGTTLASVLWHLPCALNYRPVLSKITPDYSGKLVTLPFTITAHQIPKSRRLPYKIIGESLGQTLTLVFFNYHRRYLQEKYPNGKQIWVSGKLDIDGFGFQIIHPDYLSDTLKSIPEYEVIYPQSHGVNSKLLRRIIGAIIPRLPELPEWLDKNFQAQHQLPFWKNALETAHHPKSENDLLPTNPARLRLAYDEILANQLALLLVRQSTKRQSGIQIQGSGIIVSQLKAQLPFQLTHAQEKVLIEIQRDLEDSSCMIRLLQGDVGSGKTIVALLAMLTGAEAGFQSVLMAPTDILARQHFDKISKLCAPLGVRVGLLTAREKGKTRGTILQELSQGKIQILIGTHALMTDTVIFQNLGLVVIDEQHKFGVRQRLSLIQKGKGINLLVMTATPIPRSLALTVYGDMDISRLDEKPMGRKPIKTSVMSVSKIDELVNRLKDKLTDTQAQAYWICPLVEESESSDLTAVKNRFQELQKTFGNRVGLLHGKMKGPEKDAVMQAFAQGKLDILVATTVIEVGVDVKTANIMIIEQAERFGLAGLHQLRGRIGRGTQESQCILLHGNHLTQTAQKRLQIMRETDDGFILAEEDLKIRGAGEMLGERQSGLVEFKMADSTIQSDLIWTATKDAQTILSLDPHLTSPRGEALRTLLYLFQKDSELQTLKAG